MSARPPRNRRARRAERSAERRARRRVRARQARAALFALSSSALALFGTVGNARADSPVETWAADYNASFYSEDDLSASDGLPGGETSRYEIKMQQFTLQAPVSERVDVGFDLVYETMSGASPWYVVPDAAGDPIQIMSGATIKDERSDLLLSSSYYLEEGRLGVSSGWSHENDYNAWNVGLNGERHFNQKNTTLSGGLGVSFDTIEPTDAGPLFPTRPNEEDKKSYSAHLGVSQILSRNSMIQTSLAYRASRGYLSDPYKQAYVGGLILADTRPDERGQWTWLTRYRRHFARVAGTLHADYRFYVDDWDVKSHTIELAWHQSVWDALRLIPSVRYYSQGAADFYAPFYTIASSSGLHSSDYRLSAYGAWTLGLQAELMFRTRWTGKRDWLATVGWENYLSDADYGLVDVNAANPGLVGFHVLTIGLKVKF